MRCFLYACAFVALVLSIPAPAIAEGTSIELSPLITAVDQVRVQTKKHHANGVEEIIKADITVFKLCISGMSYTYVEGPNGSGLVQDKIAYPSVGGNDIVPVYCNTAK
ncbi:hypothetical protein [Desulfovibrio ferrophilus]|uniref:ErfK/YbiS/YcfS/YnhG family protein n=1 Tax=Desulfovibrio ferrophilus TaxID=241368 RepID=A0A2Z6B3R2_9BACT|nr:hypothetical protein [Desulfovibrio ferrophilus]BBD10132.1 ErfK/YbiS/YcfS/YnhG family protein [Desulfovibrio ferrophilus]